MCESESVEQTIHGLLQILLLQGRPQLGCKGEGLSRAHCFNQNVVLLDEGSELAEIILMDVSVVCLHITVQL